MNYLFLITMKVEGYSPFIELAKEYDLKVHPNLSDKIWVEDCFCNITKMTYDVDDETIHLELLMYDPQHVCENEEQVLFRLIDDIEEFSQFGWRLNDYDEKISLKLQEKILTNS
jgi:hypothetical protein